MFFSPLFWGEFVQFDYLFSTGRVYLNGGSLEFLLLLFGDSVFFYQPQDGIPNMLLNDDEVWGPLRPTGNDSSKNRIVKQVQSWMVLATTLGNWTSYTVTTLLLHLAWRHRFTQNGECKSKVRNEEIWYSCCSREAQTLTSYLYIYKLH